MVNKGYIIKEWGILQSQYYKRWQQKTENTTELDGFTKFSLFSMSSEIKYGN
jgi:hypothetical protein